MGALTAAAGAKHAPPGGRVAAAARAAVRVIVTPHADVIPRPASRLERRRAVRIVAAFAGETLVIATDLQKSAIAVVAAFGGDTLVIAADLPTATIAGIATHVRPAVGAAQRDRNAPALFSR